MESATQPPAKRVAVIVAHPDDETLWAGGLLLRHPEWEVFILTLNHRTDPVRAPRFHRALERYGAAGDMGDLLDGGREGALPEGLVERTILRLLPSRAFDRIVTHSPKGEYTEHVMHDEVSDAVSRLLDDGSIRTPELWHFAYDDQGGAELPQAARDADLQLPLPEPVWQEKRSIITGIYGFAEDAWETRTTPRVEAFRALAGNG